MDKVEINIEDKVKSFALALGIDYNSIKPKVKQHLINIEHSISNRESKYIDLKDELQDNKITLTSIAEDARISSRQTLYNNPELKLYADTRMQQVNELNPYYLIDDLKSKINNLKEQLDLMVERDIDIEILRYEVKKLKNDILNREATIARMEEQSKEMNSKISQLKNSSSSSNSKATTSKSNILSFAKNE